MPKFIYSAAKGIEQQSGSGFQVNDVAVLEEIQALAANGASAAIEPYGITTITHTGAATTALAAPTSSEPAGVRKVISMIAYSGGGATVITMTGNGVKLAGTADLASLSFNAVGETAVLVSNGSQWVHVAGAGVTEG